MLIPSSQHPPFPTIHGSFLALLPGPPSWPSFLTLPPGPPSWPSLLALPPGPHGPLLPWFSPWLFLALLFPGSLPGPSWLLLDLTWTLSGPSWLFPGLPLWPFSLALLPGLSWWFFFCLLWQVIDMFLSLYLLFYYVSLLSCINTTYVHPNPN
ncbi:hypothetical protein BD769DRAFT_1709890 [Suillus cothurnatus]|nr:hypothetical protein BD769DRAFT_1709890 [Suillus cothurnatus]